MSLIALLTPPLRSGILSLGLEVRQVKRRSKNFLLRKFQLGLLYIHLKILAYIALLYLDADNSGKHKITYDKKLPIITHSKDFNLKSPLHYLSLPRVFHGDQFCRRIQVCCVGIAGDHCCIHCLCPCWHTLAE